MAGTNLPKVKLRLTQLTAEELRELLAACSVHRTAFNAECGYRWQPRVQCEGPDFFGAELDPLPLDTAEKILRAVQP